MSTGPTAQVRATVLTRAADAHGHPRCECCGAGRAEQIHHRRARQSGGTRRAASNLAANLLALCAGCHRDIESRRAVAYARGHLLHHTDAPAETPVRYRGWLVCLGDDGAVTTVEELSDDHR